MAGDPPPSKQVKDDDDPLPFPDRYNADEWLSSSSEEGPKAERKGKGKARASPPPNVDDSSRPAAAIPTKVAKPQPVASLLISVTGQLPQLLGKMATVSPYRTRPWYEECLLDDPRFIELWEQTNLVPLTQHSTSHHIVIR